MSWEHRIPDKAWAMWEVRQIYNLMSEEKVVMKEMLGGARRGSSPRSKKIFQEETLRKELSDMRKAARHITQRESLLRRGCSICKVVRWAPTRDLSAISVLNLPPTIHFPLWARLITTQPLLLQPTSSPLSLNQKIAHSALKARWLKALPEAPEFRSLLVFSLQADHFTFVKSSGYWLEVNQSLEYFLLKH